MNQLLSLSLVLCAATSAFAQSRTTAEQLFRQGRELLAAGKIAEACAAFEASEKADPAASTMLNLGDCREKNGQLTTAWGVFVEVARDLRDATDDRSKQFRKTALDHAAKLEPRLSKLTIRVAAEHRIAGLEVKRDGETIDAGAWDRALAIDGGSHTITVRAPGHADWSHTVTLNNERDSQVVEVPALAVVKAPPAKPTKEAVPAPRRTAHRSLLAPLVVGGVGLALGGVGLGFELAGESKYSKAKVEPDPAKQDDLWHRANTRRYAAEGFAVAGLGCIGVATWLLIRKPSHEVVVGPAAVGTVGIAIGGRL